MEKLLKQYFGYEEFRPLQKEIIEHVLEGKDAFVLMPTGGGKSLCYQLPALMLEGLTLVISPLISLMKDQVDALNANGVAAGLINSSLTYSEILNIQEEARTGKIKILYVAPERLALEPFQEFLQSLTVSLIAVDEAHCISEWGHDFRPDYRNLKAFRQQFARVPFIALTATATPKVQEDIISQLSLVCLQKYISSFDRKNLIYRIMRKKNAYDKLIKLLKKYKGESAIIYCFSRKETEAIAADLQADGFMARPYHAGLTNDQRKMHQEMFIKDEVAIIVATIAFGMGIDKPDVRLIVHYSFPKTLEGYYQEIGRAGRDGIESECVLLYSYGDKIKHEYFLDQMEDTDQQAKVRVKLNQVIEYCERTTCRRHYLLKYFGENYPEENCQGCDICLNIQETFDAKNITRKILACVVQTGSRFGRKYVIDVLKGKNTVQIQNNHHETLKVFDIVNDFTVEELQYIMRSLIDLNFLQKAEGQYPTLSLTEKAVQWIKQNQGLELQRSTSKVKEEERPSENATDMSFDQRLFEKLRRLRKQMADQRGVPPFVIFGDISLREMAYYMPSNQEDFLRVRGVGLKKMEELAAPFLALIKAYREEYQLSPVEFPTSTSRQRKGRSVQREARNVDSRYGKTKQMVLQKVSLSAMADAHGFTEGTIINHIEKLLDAGEELDLEYLKGPGERFEDINNAFEQCGRQKLKPIYEFLKEKYTYDEIRLVGLLTREK